MSNDRLPIMQSNDLLCMAMYVHTTTINSVNRLSMLLGSEVKFVLQYLLAVLHYLPKCYFISI
jgi:hypothetical protein